MIIFKQYFHSSINLMKLAIFLIILFGYILKSNAQYTDTLYTKYNKPSIVETSFAFVGMFSFAILADETVASAITTKHSNFGDIYFGFMNNLGDGNYMLPVAAIPLLTSYIIKDNKLKKTSYDAFKSALVAGLLTQGLKQTFGRARPYMEQGAYDFELFRMEGGEYRALPSGHTSLAFSLFTPYAETYSRWLYIFPVSVGIARMYKNKHWFSDVVLGAAIGYYSGLLFTYRKNQKLIFTGNSLTIRF